MGSVNILIYNTAKIISKNYEKHSLTGSCIKLISLEHKITNIKFLRTF